MKKVLVVIMMILTISLMGCEKENQRYRVEIVEKIEGDTVGDFAYTVQKYGYTTNNIWILETEQEFELDDILYVVVLDKYTCMPFAEWEEDR